MHITVTIARITPPIPPTLIPMIFLKFRIERILKPEPEEVEVVGSGAGVNSAVAFAGEVLVGFVRLTSAWPVGW
jgi:hypothetical protein